MTAQAEWDDLSRRIAELCVRIPASAGPAVLARELAGIAPELAFREVLARGGWYRLGGVVDAGGTPVADDLEQWAEAELAARDDDMGALCDAYAGRGLHATRLSGRTHYFVAACGPAPPTSSSSKSRSCRNSSAIPCSTTRRCPAASRNWSTRAAPMPIAVPPRVPWARRSWPCAG